MWSDLEVLFSSAARVQVLRLFLLHPHNQYYQREIERETGQPIRAVQREVDRLEGIGLLIRSEEGNRVFYRLHGDWLLLPELMALVQKAAGVEAGEAELVGVGLGRPAEGAKQKATAPRPAATRQPFPWMEAPVAHPLPAALQRRQVSGEWDRGY
jgi:DNA-binding transcriptional ArsR family regulator